MTKTRLFSSFFLSAALLSGCITPPGDTQITVRGSGRVTSNPEGISCASNSDEDACSSTLGRSFTLTAIAGTGAHFDHWEGDDLCVAAQKGAVTIAIAPDRKVECTAVFADGPAGQGPL